LCGSVINLPNNFDVSDQGKHVKIPRETWEQDIEQMGAVIEYGKKLADGIVDGIILPNSMISEILNSDKQNLDKTGVEALELLRDSRTMLGNGTWASVAQAQLVAVEALVYTASAGYYKPDSGN